MHSLFFACCLFLGGLFCFVFTTRSLLTDLQSVKSDPEFHLKIFSFHNSLKDIHTVFEYPTYAVSTRVLKKNLRKKPLAVIREVECQLSQKIFWLLMNSFQFGALSNLLACSRAIHKWFNLSCWQACSSRGQQHTLQNEQTVSIWNIITYKDDFCII